MESNETGFEDCLIDLAKVESIIMVLFIHDFAKHTRVRL